MTLIFLLGFVLFFYIPFEFFRPLEKEGNIYKLITRVTTKFGKIVILEWREYKMMHLLQQYSLQIIAASATSELPYNTPKIPETMQT